MFAKTNRFKTILVDGKLEIESVSLPETPSGDYLIDDSNFIPMAEAVKQLNRINDPTFGQLAQVYDFPNGKDNGKSIPLTRRHDIKDIAEISAEITAEVKDINSKISEGIDIAIEKQKFEKSIQDVKNSVSTNE